MPTITQNPKLSVTLVDDQVTLTVKYEVSFSEIDRFLSANGLKFKEVISVLGFDDMQTEQLTPVSPMTTPYGDEIPNIFQPEYIMVVPNGDLKQFRERSVTVDRQTLYEDPANENDEICIMVKLIPESLPDVVTVVTPSRSLAK